MLLRMIYDDSLAQAAYLIGCQRTGEAIIIDPQRDVDRYIAAAAREGLRITAAAETHIHADFLSGVRELSHRVGVLALLSDEGDSDWKYKWPAADGKAHRFLRDGDTFSIGRIDFRVMHTPGHTPEHICFVVTDRGGGASEPIGIATGDFVFVGDLGRPDLLETAAGTLGSKVPSARRLFQSVQSFNGLPDYLQVWPGHGSGSACGKALGSVPQSTVGYERRSNPSIRAAASEDSFVEFILEDQPDPPLYFSRMKRQNRDGPPLLGTLPQPPELSGAEAAALDSQRTAVIDTRTWKAFRAGHIAGSLYIPLDRTFPTVAGSFLGPEEPIVVVIDPGRAEDAVRALVRVGLDRIVGIVNPAAIAELEGLEASSETPAAQLAGDAFVLDVRNTSEFRSGHLPGALSIPYTRLASRLDELPRDQIIVVNCQSGSRSARAVSFLQRARFRAANLEGGYLAWQKLNTPSPAGDAR